MLVQADAILGDGLPLQAEVFEDSFEPRGEALIELRFQDEGGEFGGQLAVEFCQLALEFAGEGLADGIAGRMAAPADRDGWSWKRAQSPRSKPVTA